MSRYVADDRVVVSKEQGAHLKYTVDTVVEVKQEVGVYRRALDFAHRFPCWTIEWFPLV